MGQETFTAELREHKIVDDFYNLYDDSITNMTNTDAAKILKQLIETSVKLIGRGQGKTHKILETTFALSKAIKILESTPD